MSQLTLRPESCLWAAVLLPMLRVCEPASAQACSASRVNLDWTGAQATAVSIRPYISANGRWVTFISLAPLLPVGSNGEYQTYLRDLATGSLELLSVSPAGALGNAISYDAQVSDDGRYVSFASGATNLVPTPGFGSMRAYRRDRQTGQTEIVSLSAAGALGGSWDRAAISGDGRFVAFSSESALVAGDTNDVCDVFVRDCAAQTTELVSVGFTGAPGNQDSGTLNPLCISADGRYVVFVSGASNLVPNYVSGFVNVFRRDRASGVTELINVDSAGQQGNGHSGMGSCSRDGRFVVFASEASNLVVGDDNGAADVFVRDTVLSSTTRVSVASNGVGGDGWSGPPAVSPDGRYVAFASFATNLISGDTNAESDVFLHDRVLHRTERVSVKNTGQQTNSWSGAPWLSGDAGKVVFATLAALEPSDTGTIRDIYLRDCQRPATYCTAKTNSQGCVPRLETSGAPLGSWPSGFDVSAREVLNQKSGMLFYSTSGPAAAPFLGGTLCLQPPLRRTLAQQSGGSPTGSDCSGTYSIDFNGWISGNFDPALTAGTAVWAQYWSRDPGFSAPDNAGLTDAVSFVIWP